MNKQAIHRLKLQVSQCRKTILRHQPGKRGRNPEAFDKAVEIHKNALIKLKAHGEDVVGISNGACNAQS